MGHFIDDYADQIIAVLHTGLPNRFFRLEIIEVPGLLSSVFITYDGVLDDARESRTMTLDEFVDRISRTTPAWSAARGTFEQLKDYPEKTFRGWEGRTIYVVRGGQHPERWTKAIATSDALDFVVAAPRLGADLIYSQVTQLREFIPVEHKNFPALEGFVRITFNYLFSSELGEGQAQSRTEPEKEGVEQRDIVFHNRATSGFWHDLKNKYSASEIIVDAKNTDDLRRDDLRQLYCYLKPALGFWGFIVCRSTPSDLMRAFNRTLFQNFEQKRGLLILSDDDLRRMVEMKRREENPSVYLQQRMSEFLRSI